MIKAVIFDFDGVILDSAEIKTIAFGELFPEHPEESAKLLKYHMENMGISRYTKFRYFYETLLNTQYDESLDDVLGKRFSDIVLEKVLKSPFVPGAKTFLDNKTEDILFYIATGTPQNEIEYILKQRDLTQYFDGVYGTPMLKEDIISKIMLDSGLTNEEIIFIGDAMSDLKSAKAHNLHFYARVTEGTSAMFETQRFKSNDLNDLSRVINEINNG